MTKRKVSATATRIPSPHGRWERRLVAQSLYYWRELRGGRALPSCADLPLGSKEMVEGQGLWPYLFLVTVPDDIDDSVVTYAGSVVAEACSVDPTGKRAADCFPPSLWQRMCYAFEATAKWKKPLMVSGSFTTRGGGRALYRSIVMPMGEDEAEVRDLLGGLSFKYIER